MSTENTQNQNDAILFTRRQRRYMLKERGILKQVSKLSFFNPVRSNLRTQNMENGRKMHSQHMDIVEQRNGELLEAKLESMKNTWRGIGYNDAEINLLEEAWSLTAVKDNETYRADKKRARQLMNEARTLRAARA
jgi:hypothetical protein